ncbi:MAG TPA: hypothetical protein DD381_01665 [Lentisphaeria bacterium]|nr:MAG: hypothetical protein A2X47_10365 [Lentisphaerae bacterium GWF2_38_69]HBM15049.1 hypothetical protein [Lentisphaeria bacterium]
MNNSSENNNNSQGTLPRWLKNLGLFVLIFIIISLIGVMPEIGFLRLYFGGNINQMAFEKRPSSILWEAPAKLPGKFNEISNNYDSTISTDGSTLIFSHLFDENNYDLFISKNIDDKWTTPAPLLNINTSFNELNPDISYDGKLLFFSSDRPNGKGNFDIWCSILTKDNKWSRPYILGGEINTQYDEVFPEISPLKDALFFSSNRIIPTSSNNMQTASENRKQNFDIYRSIRMSENFQIVSTGPPAFGFVENLQDLNSQKNEGKIAVSEDGSLVYLSSDRYGGLGGYDIYVSTLKDGKYIQPINFKAPINTEYDEISPFMRMGSFKMLFSSNKNSRSYKDFHLYESKSRQVFSAINTEVILLLILIILTLSAIFLLLKYLLSNTNLSLLAKCFLASVIIHLIILLILSALYLKEQIYEEYSDEGELSIGISNLAKESIAASLKEGIASLPRQTSQSIVSKENNSSTAAQLNQQASSILEPKDFQAGENSSPTPESVASIDQTNDEASPSSGGGSMSISDISLNNNINFKMEQRAKARGIGENQNLDGDGAQDGIGSGGAGAGKTAGNRTFVTDEMPGAGIVGGKRSPSIGSISTSDIKGDKDAQSVGADNQSSGNIEGLSRSVGDTSGESSDYDNEGLDRTGDSSLGNIIASTTGDGGRDRKTAGNPAAYLPSLGQDRGKGKLTRTNQPELGFLGAGSDGSNRTLNFPVKSRTNTTPFRDLTNEIILVPRPDIPLSTYIRTLFYTKKFALLSLSGVIYTSTAQFTLPANTEMEISDKYTLKDQDIKE